MIQAPLQKPIEPPKAPRPRERDDANANVNVRASRPALRTKEATGVKAQAAKDGSAAKTDENEFAAELATSLGDAEVKPVEVSAEQALELPSSLVQPAGAGETATPKVFDPALTKDVEQLIRPTTASVTGEPAAELPGELSAELARAAKTAAPGHTPAIEFAKSEIDPQLLSNEEFVAQKNLAVKKQVPNAYGIKPVPAPKAALEAGLAPTQVVKDTAALEAPVNSQQFILGLQAEKSLPVNDAAAPAKVLDFGAVKSGNASELVAQITDYVVQARAAKEPTVNLRMNHEELGLIDISVTKAGLAADAVAINIGAHSADGKAFFQQNSKDLFSHLASAGVSVADLKVETPSSTAKNDFDLGSQSGRNSPGAERQFGSEQNQRRHESARRQELWDLLNKDAA
jgi:hypothetical protein